MPVLSNVVAEQGWSQIITLAHLVIPLAGMVTPLFLAARADQVIAAEKLLVILAGGGSIFLFLAFTVLGRGESPYLFLALLAANALLAAPCWSLLTSIALGCLRDPEREFGLYRVWGTFGWMGAGWLVSLLSMDMSPAVGKLGVVARILGAFCCLMLPHTPPQGGPPKDWRAVLGLGALRILRQRDMAVFFGTSFLFSIPLAAFYLHTPRHLNAVGWQQVAAGMTLGQVTEAVAMVLMGWFLKSWRIKWLLLLAMGAGLIRYSLYALGAEADSVFLILLGVAFHGICWCYFFEAGKVFLEKRVDKDIRTQSQALFSLLSGSLGGLSGLLIVGWIQSQLVDAETGTGWDTYWWILAGMCALCMAGFAIGYRGEPKRR